MGVPGIPDIAGGGGGGGKSEVAILAMPLCELGETTLDSANGFHMPTPSFSYMYTTAK